MGQQRNLFARSCIRLAEEVQLQAEEEWIVEALKKIKQQRNCLQIEQLHLESLKAQLNEPTTSKADKEREQYNQHVSAVNLMNPGLGSMYKQESQDMVEKDALCNEVELDLIVSKPAFEMPLQQQTSYNYDMEEDEEDDDDEDDEDEDGENMMIDINMLMNGTSDKM